MVIFFFTISIIENDDEVYKKIYRKIQNIRKYDAK